VKLLSESKQTSPPAVEGTPPTTIASYAARESSVSTTTTAPILHLQFFSSTGRWESWTYTRTRQISESQLNPQADPALRFTGESALVSSNIPAGNWL